MLVWYSSIDLPIRFLLHIYILLLIKVEQKYTVHLNIKGAFTLCFTKRFAKSEIYIIIYFAPLLLHFC